MHPPWPRGLSRGFGTEAAPPARPRSRGHSGRSGRLGACRATRHLPGAAVLRPPQVPQTAPEDGPPAVGQGRRPGTAAPGEAWGCRGPGGLLTPSAGGGGGCGFPPSRDLAAHVPKQRCGRLFWSRGGGVRCRSLPPVKSPGEMPKGPGAAEVCWGPLRRGRGAQQPEAWSRAPAGPGRLPPQTSGAEFPPESRVPASAGSGFFGFI